MPAGNATEVGRRAAELLKSLPSTAEWAPGLTATEFDALEERFAIQFADDHRAFLETGVPTGSGWPDWRYRWWGLRPDPIISWLDSPVAGVLFDVEHNQFWHPEWGVRPAAEVAAIDLAREHLLRAPRLIPVFGHRFLPPGAGLPAQAVMSVHQTDIIFYGDTLLEWVMMEFVWSSAERESYCRTPSAPRPVVPFWTDVIHQPWLDE